MGASVTGSTARVGFVTDRVAVGFFVVDLGRGAFDFTLLSVLELVVAPKFPSSTELPALWLLADPELSPAALVPSGDATPSTVSDELGGELESSGMFIISVGELASAAIAATGESTPLSVESPGFGF
ncbi:unnamed protein product [Phytophthora fragariaefolia]|uniref:Unnamed protein product n=1 Tax=Phytophthora fragariaefolia TaxID=1490495 RepID=A0A9W6YN48_9STRA|nr:unnamed protein product [Phytophthora fragariaefolia]